MLTGNLESDSWPNLPCRVIEGIKWGMLEAAFGGIDEINKYSLNTQNEMVLKFLVLRLEDAQVWIFRRRQRGCSTASCTGNGKSSYKSLGDAHLHHPCLCVSLAWDPWSGSTESSLGLNQPTSVFPFLSLLLCSCPLLYFTPSHLHASFLPYLLPFNSCHLPGRNFNRQTLQLAHACRWRH